MTVNWRQSYQLLTTYISDNPTIQIETNTRIIPVEYKDEFYRLFNRVRNDFIEEYFNIDLGLARTLNHATSCIRQECINGLDLEEVKLTHELEMFIDDPLYALTSRIYNPLIDLITGKTNHEIFTIQAQSIVKSAYQQLYATVYETWVLLSLIDIIKPEKFYNVVFAPEDHSQVYSAEENGKPINNPGQMPQMKESKHLLLDHFDIYPPYLVPDCLVFSQKLNRYFGARMARSFEHIQLYLENPGIKRGTYIFNDVLATYRNQASRPGMYVYSGTESLEVLMVADCYVIYRPDMIIETAVDGNWNDSGWPDKVRNQSALIRPHRGTVVVSSVQAPVDKQAQLLAKTENGDASKIKVISAGFNGSCLNEIIQAL